MLAVSCLLSAIHNNEPADIRLLRTNLFKEKKSTLFFSLFIFGLCVVGAVVSFFLFPLIGSVPLLAQRMDFDLGIIFGLLIGIAIVYFSAIPALKFLDNSDAARSCVLVRLARTFGVAVLVFQAALSLFLKHALPAFQFAQSTVFGFLLREAIESSVGAFPYVLLFIALAVLVSEEPMSSRSDAK
jgi:uncharacterized membrane protein